MANYSYPRVTTSVKALSHARVTEVTEDTTILFAPIIADKGPIEEITAIHSVAELIQKFGDLKYEDNGQMALNIYNWLYNGGTFYTYRLDMGIDKLVTTYPAKIWQLNGIDVKLPDYTDLCVDGATAVVKGSGDISNKSYTYNKDNKTWETDNGKTTETKTASELVSELSKSIGSSITIPANQQASVETRTYTLAETAKIVASAKYPGSYYDNMQIKIEGITSDLLNIRIFDKDNIELERYLKISPAGVAKAVSNSDYIGSITFSSDSIIMQGNSYDMKFGVSNTIDKSTKNKYEENDESASASIMETKLYNFWKNDAGNILVNRLDPKIDVIMDAGYSYEIKKMIAKFISDNNDDSLRPDVIGFFDDYALPFAGKLENITTTNSLQTKLAADTDSYFDATNIAIYTQYFMINDSIFTGQPIYVCPTYFLSKLIPYNDISYGVQFPTAGLRRGILDDMTWVNENPAPRQKQALFDARINYVEKTTRESAFMTQRTHKVDEDTALSFINNVRCLNKMEKEIEEIGRYYLHELNDSTTLTQLQSVLNRYITNWISNRTLQSGTVLVSRSDVSDEEVVITLTIKFTNTIEVISVDIVIE